LRWLAYITRVLPDYYWRNFVFELSWFYIKHQGVILPGSGFRVHLLLLHSFSSPLNNLVLDMRQGWEYFYTHFCLVSLFMWHLFYGRFFLLWWWMVLLDDWTFTFYDELMDGLYCVF
jgi:hypothetical protein